MKSKLKDCVAGQIEISWQTLDHIADQFSPLLLDRKESFVDEGAYCKRLAFIAGGALRIYNVREGDEISLWIGTESQFVTALSSFLFREPSRWFIEAIISSQLLVIERERHLELLEEYPKWLEFDNRILANAYAMMEQRMFSHLYMSAEERYLQLEEHRPELFQTVPVKYIASMLGMTPETLSRMRRNRMD